MVIKIKHRLDEYIEFQIDEQDLHLVIGQRCRAAKRVDKFYLFNMDANKYVHRMIMNNPDKLCVDHIDGDPTNNLRSNLRLVTPQQNASNQSKSKNASSQYKGVCYYPKLNKYRAYINCNGQRINLGYYGSELDAAKAYNDKASELFGEYAKLNPI
jgi:hypothetical protein